MLSHLESRCPRRGTLLLTTCLLLPAAAGAQTQAEWKTVLDRLDRLEAENRSLREEIGELRRQAIANHPPTAVEERIEIQEERIREQAQTKVESSQKLPLRVTGMALFNAFLNGRGSGGADNPPLAARNPGSASGGGTLRQSVVGLQYEGTSTVWGGKVRGSLYADFFSGTGDSLNQQARIRTGSIELDWASRSILVGQEKPIFAPREPNSLAQVGISPLTGAGNLWRWQPQVRFEQRFRLGEQTQFSAQMGVLQTNEDTTSVQSDYSPTVARRRPGLEGRFLFSRKLDDARRLEIAPGFHASTSHVAETSVSSNLFSLDWFANPWRKLEFTGAFFTGQNVGHFGAPRQGFRVISDYEVIPIHSRGGWAQISLLATPRLSFNLMGGRHDDRNRDLIVGQVGKNTTGAANIMYRISPNVVVSLEASQVRTDYIGSGIQINNHYDLALAYLF